MDYWEDGERPWQFMVLTRVNFARPTPCEGGVDEVGRKVNCHALDLKFENENLEFEIENLELKMQFW